MQGRRLLVNHTFAMDIFLFPLHYRVTYVSFYEKHLFVPSLLCHLFQSRAAISPT